MPSLWVERAAICPDGPSPASGEGSTRSGRKNRASEQRKDFFGHRKAVGADAPRLPLERICAQYGFGFFAPEKSKFVASTAKRQERLSRGKPGPPLPCFASFCRSKRKAPAASRTDYAFAKGCATPTGEIKLLPFAGNPSVSLAADSFPYTEGSLLGGAAPTGEMKFSQKKLPRPLPDGGKMFFVTWRCSGCRGGYP